jgi:hypothetical protein
LGIQPDNYLPWCVRPAPGAREAVEAMFAERGLHPSLMPICPDTLFATAFGGKEIHLLLGNGITPGFDNTAVRQRITRRGAMNAGAAAFYYLDGLTKGLIEPTQPFDVCEATP